MAKEMERIAAAVEKAVETYIESVAAYKVALRALVRQAASGRTLPPEIAEFTRVAPQSNMEPWPGIDYSVTFADFKERFVTLSHIVVPTTGSPKSPEELQRLLKSIEQVRHLLQSEADENLVHDHFHPEIAGPLQLSLYFLQLVTERCSEALASNDP